MFIEMRSNWLISIQTKIFQNWALGLNFYYFCKYFARNYIILSDKMTDGDD